MRQSWLLAKFSMPLIHSCFFSNSEPLCLIKTQSWKIVSVKYYCSICNPSIFLEIRSRSLIQARPSQSFILTPLRSAFTELYRGVLSLARLRKVIVMFITVEQARRRSAQHTVFALWTSPEPQCQESSTSPEQLLLRIPWLVILLSSSVLTSLKLFVNCIDIIFFYYYYFPLPWLLVFALFWCVFVSNQKCFRNEVGMNEQKITQMYSLMVLSSLILFYSTLVCYLISLTNAKPLRVLSFSFLDCVEVLSADIFALNKYAFIESRYCWVYK